MGTESSSSVPVVGLVGLVVAESDTVSGTGFGVEAESSGDVAVDGVPVEETQFCGALSTVVRPRDAELVGMGTESYSSLALPLNPGYDLVGGGL